MSTKRVRKAATTREAVVVEPVVAEPIATEVVLPVEPAPEAEHVETVVPAVADGETSDQGVADAAADLQTRVADTTQATEAEAPLAPATTQAGAAVVRLLEPKPAPVFPVPASEIKLLQERTKKLPLPTTFHLEGDLRKVKKPRGHQVDPTRLEGWAPVMPNVDLLAVTGNPYPANPADETIGTADRYKSLASVSCATWDYLVLHREIDLRQSDPGAAILRKVGVPDTTDGRYAIRDTLRDLALFGLCDALMVGPSRIFRRKP